MLFLVSLTLASSWLYNPPITLLPKKSFSSSTQIKCPCLQYYILDSVFWLLRQYPTGSQVQGNQSSFPVQNSKLTLIHLLYLHSHFWASSQTELLIPTLNTNCAQGSGNLDTHACTIILSAFHQLSPRPTQKCCLHHVIPDTSLSLKKKKIFSQLL